MTPVQVAPYNGDAKGAMTSSSSSGTATGGRPSFCEGGSLGKTLAEVDLERESAVVQVRVRVYAGTALLMAS